MAKEDKSVLNELVGNKPARAPDANELALLRTLMAADRSLIAWVRTGLSLITFGFTVYKFLQFDSQKYLAAGQAALGASSPRVVGLFMIGVGMLCLAMGMVENLITVRGLRGRENVVHPRYSLVMAGMILTLGLVVFVGILFRVKGIV